MTADRVFDYLTHYAMLEFQPGTAYQYSNFGYGLLGYILARNTGSSYEAVLKKVVLDELGMVHTRIHLTDHDRQNLATGYDKDGMETALFATGNVLVGAGHLKSNLQDLMVYLRANLDLLDSSLAAAISLARQPHLADSVCLGWFLRELDDGQIVVTKGGATRGFLAFMAFNPTLKTGVVILYNYTRTLITETVGLRILDLAND
jgi:CubicO group peptidase (beta-lactamase class C family)